MTDSAPTCFIAMPVSTSSDAGSLYGDPDHFLHVLDHLFVPAVERAGYKAVSPVMSGADLIHAEIVRNLESADLVLCDLTGLNPNVFFELGIRTALDRPVALVRDTLTSALPFDTGILNTYSYDSSLAPWHLEGELEKLTNHLLVTAQRADGHNPLWTYFGLTQRAAPDSGEKGNPVLDKLDLIIGEITSAPNRHREPSPIPRREDPAPERLASSKRIVRERPDYEMMRDPQSALPSSTRSGEVPHDLSSDQQELLTDLGDIADELSARLWLISMANGEVELDARPFVLSSELAREMADRAAQDGFELKITYSTGSGEEEAHFPLAR